MSRKVLIATVGASVDPLIEAVKRHGAAMTYFLCSPDTQSNVPNILAQVGRPDYPYQIVPIADPDSVEDCYGAAKHACEDALGENPDSTLIVDYTGGTKTMSSTLFFCASSDLYIDRVQLWIIKVRRAGSVGVVRGTENRAFQDVSAIVLERQWNQALDLLNDYHFSSANEVLGTISGRPLPNDSPLRGKTQILSEICRGLDAWDRFDHGMAYPLLQGVGRLHAALATAFRPQLDTLRLLVPLTKADAAPPGWDKGGILLVYDLLNNAARRGAQGRYDDAVARLYRALELLAQARLHGEYGIDTARIDPEKAAEWLVLHPDRASERPLQIGLRAGYEVLGAKHDPVGQAFERHDKRLSNVLQRRNTSVLAHGMQPITAAEYSSMEAVVRDFLREARAVTAINVREPEQFPRLKREDWA